MKVVIISYFWIKDMMFLQDDICLLNQRYDVAGNKSFLFTLHIYLLHLELYYMILYGSIWPIWMLSLSCRVPLWFGQGSTFSDQSLICYNHTYSLQKIQHVRFWEASKKQTTELYHSTHLTTTQALRLPWSRPIGAWMTRHPRHLEKLMSSPARESTKVTQKAPCF